jgi:hypothetical protein
MERKTWRKRTEKTRMDIGDLTNAVNNCEPGKMATGGKKGRTEMSYRGISSPWPGFSAAAGRSTPPSPALLSSAGKTGSVSSFGCFASARRAALSFCFCCRAISLCRFSKVNFVLAMVRHHLPLFPDRGNYERKKEAPRGDSLAPECLFGHCVEKLHGFYVFGCRTLLTLCNIETDALTLG